jgi:hypothetical protein
MADKAEMLAAVAQNGKALRHADAALKGDREVVLAAVAQDGDALEYADAALQTDPVLNALASVADHVLAHELLRLRLYPQLACVPTMLEQGITLAMLQALRHPELKELGMANMGERLAFLAAVQPEPEPEDEEGVPPRTFATSNFKREYAKVGVVPIRRAHQVMAHLDTFLYTFVHAYGIAAEADGRLEPFLAALQSQVQAHAAGPSNQLLTEVGDTAELLWTSARTFAGMGEFNKQLCSLLNRAIRDDHPDLAASTAALARSLNALCVVAPRAGAAAPQFPAGGITWRGTGFDDSLRDFFAEGKEYRVPGFLATSFSQLKAREFIYNEATAYGIPGVLWTVHVDPAGAQDPARRCKNVNFVRHSLVAGEQEYLFAAYSVFTIRRVTWSADPTITPHAIELDAALDNALCSEDLPLAPWY